MARIDDIPDQRDGVSDAAKDGVNGNDQRGAAYVHKDPVRVTGPLGTQLGEAARREAINRAAEPVRSTDIAVTRRNSSGFQTIQQSWATSSVPTLALAAGIGACFPRVFVSTVVPRGYPSPASCLFFGGILGASGYVLQTGDIENGSILSSVWSAAYLLVNGKHALRSFRMVPLTLSALATGNVIMYGEQYIRMKAGI